MIERIVQLRESEYEELAKTAGLKKKQIAEQAQKLWKEKGAATIDITIHTTSDIYCTRSFDCKAQVWYKNERFFIPLELRERLSKFLKEEIAWEMERRYGEPMKLVSHYNKKIACQNKWFKLEILVAASGWAVAVILLLVG